MKPGLYGRKLPGSRDRKATMKLLLCEVQYGVSKLFLVALGGRWSLDIDSNRSKMILESAQPVSPPLGPLVVARLEVRSAQ